MLIQVFKTRTRIRRKLVYISILLLPFFSIKNVFGQDLSPWLSSFVIEAGSYSDTVFIRCDTAGKFGYQNSLDKLDSPDSTQPLRIVAYDSLIQISHSTPTCGNLNIDSKGFKDDSVHSISGGYYQNAYSTEFTFFVYQKSSTTGNINPILSWNKNDYVFSNDSMKITSAVLINSHGYFNNIGAGLNAHQLFENLTIGQSGTFGIDSVALISEEVVPVICNTEYGQYDIIYKLKLSLIFNWTDTSRLIGGSDESVFNSNQVIVYPSPCNTTLSLGLPNLKKGMIQIADLMGRIVVQKKFESSDNFAIQVDQLDSGLYLIYIFDEKNVLYNSVKTRVQH